MCTSGIFVIPEGFAVRRRRRSITFVAITNHKDFLSIRSDTIDNLLSCRLRYIRDVAIREGIRLWVEKCIGLKKKKKTNEPIGVIGYI